MKHTKLLIISSFFCLYACSSDKIGEAESISNTRDLDTEFITLHNQVDSNWIVLNQNELNKIQLLKRLSEEISYNPKHSPQKKNQLDAKLKIIEANLLTPEALDKDSAIDKYDISIDGLISEIESLASNTPDMENYKNVDELLIEINQLNSSQALQDRINYSNSVKEYNDYITNHKKELKKKDLHLKPKPSFFIEE